MIQGTSQKREGGEGRQETGDGKKQKTVQRKDFLPTNKSSNNANKGFYMKKTKDFTAKDAKNAKNAKNAKSKDKTITAIPCFV